MKNWIIEVLIVIGILLIYIIQVPFTIFVKLFTGKWIIQHIDEAFNDNPSNKNQQY